jgi:hypothetical protein
MPRRRTVAQSLRSLVLELVALVIFFVIMLNVVLPWGMKAIVDSYRSTITTPQPTLNASPSN